MLNSLFDDEPFYVRVLENKIEVRKCDGENHTIYRRATKAFSSQRLLVGDFVIAEKLLLDALKELSVKSLFKKQPKILIHSVEKSEGGLSEVEVRVLRELAYGAGGRDVIVWHGNNLTDDEVKQKFNDK